MSQANTSAVNNQENNEQKRIYLRENKDGSYNILAAGSQEVKQALSVQKQRDSLAKQIAELTKELASITSNCSHDVAYDEPGLPYDVRICVKCDHRSLI